MAHAGVSPSETLIFEDSHHGREAALASGAHLCPVRSPSEVDEHFIANAIAGVESGGKPRRTPWYDPKLNVLIPMAGAGSRFEKAGYSFPKPLIEVHGKPMIQVVVESLNIEANYIFLVQKGHYDRYSLNYILNGIAPGCTIIQVDELTEGAACTTLLAKEHINNDSPLLIANSDQWLDWDSNGFMYRSSADEIDGSLLCFRASHPKWSFVRLGEDGLVAEVAEKRPISDLASTGIYYFKHGKDYVNAAESMIRKDIRTNGEFYVCPVFNEMIEDGKKIKVVEIASDQMWGLGTPEDLQRFLQREEAG